MDASVILVVDDEVRVVDMYVRNLEGWGGDVLTAHSLDVAFEAYAIARERLVAIVLDGCVPGNQVNTDPFIKQVADDIKQGRFTGILVAASSLASYRRRMVSLGCTHESPKNDAVAMVLGLLDSTT